MTLTEVIRILEAKGWQTTKRTDSYCQLRSDSQPGTVTLAGKSDLAIPPNVLRQLRRYLHVEEES